MSRLTMFRKVVPHHLGARAFCKIRPAALGTLSPSRQGAWLDSLSTRPRENRRDRIQVAPLAALILCPALPGSNEKLTRIPAGSKNMGAGIHAGREWE